MRSVSFGIWVAIGSRDETPAQSGCSHFLEHLLFKGTQKRSALDISAQIEAVGGETNAFTTKEYTCYYARVLDADLPLAIDVMCDLVADSVLAPADVETERGVILEEIAMHDDEPGDEVHDLFAAAVYGEHPLGRLISGTAETISPMTRRQIETFYRRHYMAPSIVIAAAGNLDHAAVVKLVRAALAGTVLDSPAAARRRAPLVDPARSSCAAARSWCRQGHRAGPRGARRRRHRPPRRAAVRARRAQQRARRRHVQPAVPGDPRAARPGLLGLLLRQPVRRQRPVRRLRRLRAGQGRRGARPDPRRAGDGRRDGVTEAEVARGKGMLKGSLVLGLEDTGSRMSRLAKGELLYGDLLTVDELLAKVDAVTLDEVNALAAELCGQPMSLAVIGPFDDGDVRFVHRLGYVTDEREPVRVGVLGARGRMGIEVCQAVDAADDLELVAMVDQGDWLFNASDAGAEVVVDFTTPDVVMDNLHWCIDQGINAVVGTTGFTEQRLDRVRGWLAHKPEVGVVVAPNFGIGAVLMMQFAAKAARYFESVEIIELHHPRKLDAPSGTAMHTAQLIAAARAEAGLGPVPDATKDEVPARAAPTSTGCACTRCAPPAWSRTRRCCSAPPARRSRSGTTRYDRASFMPGVLLAVRAVRQRPGLTVGLDPLLD